MVKRRAYIYEVKRSPLASSRVISWFDFYRRRNGVRVLVQTYVGVREAGGYRLPLSTGGWAVYRGK